MPRPFGFMDPELARAMNWQQSQGPLSPMETANIDQLIGQNAAADYRFQPMAPSFIRRFGQDLEQPRMMPEQQQNVDLAQLQAALQQAAGGAFQQGPRRSIIQHEGNLTEQPWYDEYLALSEASGGQGGIMPTVQATPPDPFENDVSRPDFSGIRERRAAQRAQAMEMIHNRAAAASDQRGMRMGKLSGQEAQFNTLWRAGLLGDNGSGEGGGDQFMRDTVLHGPDVAMKNKGLAAEQADRQAQRDAARAEGEAGRDAVAAQAQAQREALAAEGAAGRTATAAQSEQQRALQRELGQGELDVKKQEAADMATYRQQQAGVAGSEQALARQAKVAEYIAAKMQDPSYMAGLPSPARMQAAKQEAESLLGGGQTPGLPSPAAPTAAAQPFDQATQFVLDPANASLMGNYDEALRRFSLLNPGMGESQFLEPFKNVTGEDPYSAGRSFTSPTISRRILERQMGYGPGQSGIPNIVPPGAPAISELILNLLGGGNQMMPPMLQPPPRRPVP